MDSTTSQAGLAAVQRFYELIGAGKMDEVTTVVREDLVIHEPPSLPFGGEYQGPDAFRDIMGRIIARYEIETVGEVRFFDAGNPVVVRLRGRFTSRESGQSAETEVTELFTIVDGRIAEIDIYYKDPGAVAALVGR